jgi:hypothetical protein
MATTITRSEQGAPPADGPRLLDRAEEKAVAFFATWMIIGLFVDGWAHNAEKPETFFTPWHGVLYSGFAAAMAWGAWHYRDDVRAGPRRILGGGRDRLMTVGVVLFVLAGVSDMLWHEVFGVEADVEALLSPTHLMLMFGGILMASAPLRSAWSDRSVDTPEWRSFLPAAVCLTLTTALIAFFLQFASAFRLVEHDAFGPFASEVGQIWGLVAIQLTNVLLVAVLLLSLRRWVPPRGTFTMLFGGVALFMAGLQAFDEIALVVPALLGGLTADVLTTRLRPGPANVRAAWLTAAGTAFVLWSAWFATYAAIWDLAWTVELWSGSIVYAVLGAVGLALLAFPPSGARDLRSVDFRPVEGGN